MFVNLKCSQCKYVYIFDVGTPSTDKNLNLVWENKTVCPRCGAVDKDLLTEMGQSQMTSWYFENK